MPEDEPAEEEDDDKRQRSILPEGHRVVRKKRRKSRASSRETLILKKREIISEMVEPEDLEPLNVRGQVERLRKAQKDKKEAVAPMEDKWGSRQHRRKGSRWLIVSIFGVVIPLLAFVVAITLNRSSHDPATARGTTTLNLDEEEPLVMPLDATDPGAWFQDHSVDAFDDAIDILDEINNSESSLATLYLMRDEGKTGERMRSSQFEWQADFRVSDPRGLGWEYGASGDTGYMVILGRNSAFNPFRAYFVNTPNGLRLDWAATTAWSEVPVGSLVAARPALPVSVRGWVVKKPHFDSDGAKLISWYQVLSKDKNESVWAYTPVDSEIDLTLKRALSYGTIVMARVDELRMTLRLRAGDRSRRPNDFELIEIVSEDWVQP